MYSSPTLYFLKYNNPVNALQAVCSAVSLFCCWWQNVCPNEDKIKTILEASDLKKLEKAESAVENADKLMEEANQFYLETFAVQGNYEMDEKQKEKVNQLEGQARQKITEAAALYQKGHEVKYGCTKLISKNTGRSIRRWNFKYWHPVNWRTIQWLYYQALTLRNEANKMPDGNEKIEKLNQATNMKIRPLITAVSIGPVLRDRPVRCHNRSSSSCWNECRTGSDSHRNRIHTHSESYQPAEIQPPETTLPDAQHQPPVLTAWNRVARQVVINQEMIDLYNRYVASEEAWDSLTTTGFSNSVLLMPTGSSTMVFLFVWTRNWRTGSTTTVTCNWTNSSFRRTSAAVEQHQFQPNLQRLGKKLFHLSNASMFRKNQLP